MLCRVRLISVSVVYQPDLRKEVIISQSSVNWRQLWEDYEVRQQYCSCCGNDPECAWCGYKTAPSAALVKANEIGGDELVETVLEGIEADAASQGK